MRMFRRRRALPAGHRPALAASERVLAWAPVAAGGRAGGVAAAGTGGGAAGGVVVVTNLGLWLPEREHRLGWHEVHKATWSGTELAITPAAVTAERDGYAVMADQPVRRYRLDEPGDVPDQVRTRVTRSVAYTQQQPVPGGGGVRVAARRVSGVDGLTWTVRYEPGTDPDDPAVVAATGDLVAAARAAASGPR